MDVAIIGVGLFPFGRHPQSDVEMAATAATRALADAGLGWPDIQFAVGGSTGPTSPDTTLTHLGLTGVPFLNVANGCATGASALTVAANAISAGTADVAIAIGFDKHPRGAFSISPEALGLPGWLGAAGFMVTTQFFGTKINRYMHDHGISATSLAKVAARAYRNGALNPDAWRRTEVSEEEIAGAHMLNYPLTRYMFCAPNEGAAAVVMCRAEDAHRYGGQPVFLRAVAIRTRTPGSVEVFSTSLPPALAESPTIAAAAAAYEMAGIGPEDIDIAQLQDTDAGSEIIHLAESGLCKPGDQEAMLLAGDTEINGRLPINTDGGLIANGEPAGASGLRQTYEIVTQLRGRAGARQVPKTLRAGLTQVYGSPGLSAVAILST